MKQKKTNKKLLTIAAAIMILAVSCEDNNSLHQKYIDAGETYYTGKPDSAVAMGGNERVKLTWRINADPRITATVIYWNNRADSTVVPVEGVHRGMQQYETICDVSEGSYDFVFMTRDNDGHSSLEAPYSTQVYGPNYAAALANRSIEKYSLSSGVLVIEWTAVSSALIVSTSVTYTDRSNASAPVQRTVEVANEDVRTELSGARSGDTFQIITIYCPVGAFENINAPTLSLSVP